MAVFGISRWPVSSGTTVSRPSTVPLLASTNARDQGRNLIFRVMLCCFSIWLRYSLMMPGRCGEPEGEQENGHQSVAARVSWDGRLSVGCVRPWKLVANSRNKISKRVMRNNDHVFFASLDRIVMNYNHSSECRLFCIPSVTRLRLAFIYHKVRPL